MLPSYSSRVAIIVCPQPVAAEIGLEVMRRGGNAVDAAVTCAFVQGVIDPQMCSIGGGGAGRGASAPGGGAPPRVFGTAGPRAPAGQWGAIFIRAGGDAHR